MLRDAQCSPMPGTAGIGTGRSSVYRQRIALEGNVQAHALSPPRTFFLPANGSQLAGIPYRSVQNSEFLASGMAAV